MQREEPEEEPRRPEREAGGAEEPAGQREEPARPGPNAGPNPNPNPNPLAAALLGTHSRRSSAADASPAARPAAPSNPLAAALMQAQSRRSSVAEQPEEEAEEEEEPQPEEQPEPQQPKKANPLAAALLGAQSPALGPSAPPAAPKPNPLAAALAGVAVASPARAAAPEEEEEPPQQQDEEEEEAPAAASEEEQEQQLPPVSVTTPGRVLQATGSMAELEAEAELLQRLEALQRRLADAAGVAPEEVFTAADLDLLVESRPDTAVRVGAVLGQERGARWGRLVADEVRRFNRGEEPPASASLESDAGSSLDGGGGGGGGGTGGTGGADPATDREWLVRGRVFLKVGRKGRPHDRFVSVLPDLSAVVWSDQAGGPAAGQLPTADLEAVLPGWQTDVFRRGGAKSGGAALREDRCLSLVFVGRTLDLQAHSVAERDAWVRRFEWLRAEKSERGVGRPFNVRHVAHVNLDFEWTGEDLQGTFEVVRKLGEGSFGEVYSVRHTPTGLLLAAKMVPIHDKAEAEEVAAEVAILKKLRHKNVVNYYGCWGPDDRGRLWVLMEYCGGGSLHDLVAQGRLLSEAMISAVSFQVIQALQYLHRNQIIHRDIKGANLLLDLDGTVKLCDFGIAKALEHGADRGQMSMPAGTPLWMAPEVIEGRSATERADVWSLGITLIELADGRPPHAALGAVPVRAMHAILDEDSPTLEDEDIWTAEFCDFVAECVAKHEPDRADCAALIRHPFALRAVGQHDLGAGLRALLGDSAGPAFFVDPPAPSPVRTATSADAGAGHGRETSSGSLLGLARDYLAKKRRRSRENEMEQQGGGSGGVGGDGDDEAAGTAVALSEFEARNLAARRRAALARRQAEEDRRLERRREVAAFQERLEARRRGSETESEYGSERGGDDDDDGGDGGDGSGGDGDHKDAGLAAPPAKTVNASMPGLVMPTLPRRAPAQEEPAAQPQPPPPPPPRRESRAPPPLPAGALDVPPPQQQQRPPPPPPRQAPSYVHTAAPNYYWDRWNDEVRGVLAGLRDDDLVRFRTAVREDLEVDDLRVLQAETLVQCGLRPVAAARIARHCQGACEAGLGSGGGGDSGDGDGGERSRGGGPSLAVIGAVAAVAVAGAPLTGGVAAGSVVAKALSSASGSSAVGVGDVVSAVGSAPSAVLDAVTPRSAPRDGAYDFDDDAKEADEEDAPLLSEAALAAADNPEKEHADTDTDTPLLRKPGDDDDLVKARRCQCCSTCPVQ